MGAPVPPGVPSILGHFWEYTKKQAKKFAQYLTNPEKGEEELLKAVVRDFKKEGRG
ncbi:MAG: hypothetical protein FD145_1039 [Candidatus Saganbacteria bacterium]|uniref:Uncharacterized protein n=1 Tax=Candidatus Saganbacteria bacterium TaxID=2575572 RepID=A0A833L0L7_UNCSA|nr:MAG: hypothetical protein FD145_1039 [Candidatus Saganbacteria bacterium]